MTSPAWIARRHFRATPVTSPAPHPRTAEFLRELRALGQEAQNDRRPADRAHFTRIAVAGRLLTALGLGTAWWGLNPISVLAIALGSSIRWTVIAHHTLHGSFDDDPDAPRSRRSRTFAHGWRRFLDWADWIPPAAWKVEHNTLHHHRLGEIHDPDVPESNMEWLRSLRLPRPLAFLVLLFCAALWRPVYYGPNALRQVMARGSGTMPASFQPFNADVYLPWRPLGRQVWSQVWLPSLLLRFVLLPLCFAPLGPAAVIAVLLNLLVAEVVTNLHTFGIIVPNHAGDDVWRFSTPPRDGDDLALRQLFGSVNYRTGGTFNDVLHGYLNYQIEHHVWPRMSPAQLARVQPRFKELCERHGMPYVQQSVWRRIAAMVRNVLGGTTSPLRESMVTSAPLSAPPAPVNETTAATR
jgi:fatty acid desaturase